MPEQELYTATTETCRCPIHATGSPRTVPNGIDFAHRVSVAEIDQRVAREIYRAHHSYMPSIPDINICHHGIYFDDQLVGAITYRQPLLNRLKLYEHPTGGYTRDGSVGENSFMVSGGDVVEVARICIGVPFHNLASCGLAASMDQFVHNDVARLDIDWLLTFIRADHTGSMLRALCDKGWDLVGMSEPRQAGNRPDTGIREWPKQRWLCHIPDAPVPDPTAVDATHQEIAAD